MKQHLKPVTWVLSALCCLFGCEKEPFHHVTYYECQLVETLLDDDLKSTYYYDSEGNLQWIDWVNAQGVELTGTYFYNEDKISICFTSDSVLLYRWDADLNEEGYVSRMEVKEGRYVEFDYRSDGQLQWLSIYDDNALLYTFRYIYEYGILVSGLRSWTEGRVDTFYFEWYDEVNVKGYYSIHSLINFMEYPTWSGLPIGEPPPFLIKSETQRLGNGNVFIWENEYWLNDWGYVDRWIYTYTWKGKVYPARIMDWSYLCET